MDAAREARISQPEQRKRGNISAQRHYLAASITEMNQTRVMSARGPCAPIREEESSTIKGFSVVGASFCARPLESI